MRLLLTLIFLLTSINAFSDSELIYEAQKKQIQLTDTDKKILEIGEISTTRYVIGGVLGTYPIGLGLGHAVQGRWSEDGKIFTFGELGALAVLFTGAVSCMNHVENADNDEWDCSSFDSALIAVGAIGYVGLRIWEAIDVWATPPSYNLKHRKLQKYIEQYKQPDQIKSSLDLVPVYSPRMGQGLGLKYTF